MKGASGKTAGKSTPPKIPRSLRAFVRYLVFTILLSMAPILLNPAGAQDDKSSPIEPSPPPSSDLTLRRVLTKKAGLGKTVEVEIDGLSEALKTGEARPKNFLLYLDGQPLPDVRGESPNLVRNTLKFMLQRTEESREAWVRLLGRPKGTVRRNIMVGVGTDERQLDVVPGAELTIDLVVFEIGPFIVASVLLVVAIIAFWSLTKRSNIIRDSNPPQPPPGMKKPYSLARLQMAGWFFVVLASFLFIGVITGEYGITDQALILIGIGTGTALGAAIIDANRQETVDSDLAKLLPEQAELSATIDSLSIQRNDLQQRIASQPPGTADDVAKLTALQVTEATKQAELKVKDEIITDVKAKLSSPVSVGFIPDILTDAYGISFHRFQMFVWTIVLILLFLWGTFVSLAMPQFNTTLLALMGISSGTYLGFKIPERQS